VAPGNRWKHPPGFASASQQNRLGVPTYFLKMPATESVSFI
jgi:hypothetical protein